MVRVLEFIKDVWATIVIFLLLMLMVGCATKVEYRYIDLPEPAVVARPDLKTQNLKAGDPPATVIQAHREDVLNLQSWGKQLESLLDGYRKVNRPTPPAPTAP